MTTPRIIKDGIFYRILLADGEYASKKKFLRLTSAIDYLDMMDVHGVPVIKHKEEK